MKTKCFSRGLFHVGPDGMALSHLLLVLPDVTSFVFRPTFEGCPEAAFKPDLLCIQRTNLQTWPPGAASLKDTGLTCVHA